MPLVQLTPREEVMAVAAIFPTPSVLKAVRCAELGHIEWTAIQRLFENVLQEAVEAVRSAK